MSEFLQSGQHIDADQVSALVDHALPPHEREAVLAHLAVCGECRETVTLVSPPIETAPIETVKEKRPRWFFSLSVLAPVAAAGLAAILLYMHLAAHPHGGPGGAEPQIAQEIPASPIIAAKQSAPTPKTSSESRTELKKESIPATAATDRNTPALDAMSASSAEQATVGSRFLAGNQLAAPAATPQAKSAPAPQAANGQSGAQNEVGARLTSGAPTAAPAPVPQQIAAQAGISQESGAHTDVLSSKDIDTLALEGRDTTELLKVLPGFVTPLRLPGGARPLSTVTRGKQVLAIGARNKVYLSNDGGTTWTSVRVPWKSRAVKAEVVSYSGAERKERYVEARRGIVDGAPTSLAAPAASAVPAPTSPVAALNLPASPPGSLVGTVTDETGGVIPHASLTVTNSMTHVTQVAATNASGQYRIEDLPPGDYDIRAKAHGFNASVSSVQVASTRVNVANFALTVGAETLTVTVSASEEMIPTTSPTSNELIGGATDKHIDSLQAPPPASGLFQITTKDGEHWTSADGLTWQRK